MHIPHPPFFRNTLPWLKKLIFEKTLDKLTLFDYPNIIRQN